ncbi:MAG TPA: HDOD domain-containing protein [Terracidiphilus sp.]|jgi:EAL and modified HD-GYP domain-containing signal transduction protein|nr:HDOD domain-containing protein [Terracidiphilus sp.]
MDTPVRSVSKTEDTQPRVPGLLYMVVRQPILDLRGRVHAYELLLRGRTALSGNGEPVVRTVAETAAFFALQKPSELKKLTGKMTALVSCCLEDLSDQLTQKLPATLTVLEIPGSLEMPPELIAVCQQLKTEGFRFALDDFKWQAQFKPLMELADYIKVDFDRTSKEERRELFEQLRGKPIGMLAKNIDTQANYARAREDGFELFEGYYFCEPVPVRNRRPPVNQILRIDILRALQQTPLEVHKVSPLVKRDGPLTYQLLRLANSPLWAVRTEIDSIEQALMTVGDDAFRRIATTAIASEFNGNQPPELLCMAMVRGRFCEVAGAKRNLDPFLQYLLGLLSLLPAMQGQAMKDIAPTLPFGDEIREALLGTKNPERVLLGWLEKCERGDWAGCDAAAEADSLNQQELAKIYVDAVAWAEAALHSAA